MKLSIIKMDKKIEHLISYYRKEKGLADKISNEDQKRYSKLTYEKIFEILSGSCGIPKKIISINTNKDYINFIDYNGLVKSRDLRRIGFQLDEKDKSLFYPI
jgi:hypothetical protein